VFLFLFRTLSSHDMTLKLLFLLPQVHLESVDKSDSLTWWFECNFVYVYWMYPECLYLSGFTFSIRNKRKHMQQCRWSTRLLALGSSHTQHNKKKVWWYRPKNRKIIFNEEIFNYDYLNNLISILGELYSWPRDRTSKAWSQWLKGRF
jgi:hypothetical protein